MTITLNGAQILTLMVAFLTSAIHIFTAMIGFRVTRANKPRNRLFALTFLGLAWICTSLGLAKAGFGEIFPPIVAAAPLLSGYCMASYSLFCETVVFPKQRPNYWLFALGGFGTLYATIVLLVPGGTLYVHEIIQGRKVDIDFRIVVPFTMHSLALIVLMVRAVAVLYHGSKISQDTHQRAARKLLMTGNYVFIGMFLVANVAPLTGFLDTVWLAPFATLPICWLAWRLLETIKTDETPTVSAVIEMNTRLNSLGRMARGMAHDFNNALGRLVGHAELAMLKIDDPLQARKHLDSIVKLSQQAADLSHELMAVSSKGRGESEPIDIGAVVLDTLKVIDGTLGNNVRLDVQISDELPLVAVKSNALSAAIINLLLNARDSLEGSEGLISVKLCHEESAVVPQHAIGESLDTLPAVYLEVRDSGCGMTKDVAAHVFDPFYSTKPNGKGLGLANVLASVREAGGAVVCETREGEGTSFRVWLPLGTPTQERTEHMVTSVQKDGGARRVLLVEDDQELGTALKEMIESLDYRCVHVTTAEASLDELAKNPHAATIFVCDIQLPSMNGLDLAAVVRQKYAYPFLFISGNVHASQLPELSHETDCIFLRKPVSLGDLKTALSRLELDGYTFDSLESIA